MEPRKTKNANLENKKSLFFQLGLIAALLIVFSAFEWGVEDRNISILSGNAAKITDDDIIPIIVPEKQAAPEVRPPAVSEQFQIVDNNIAVPDFIILKPDDNSAVTITPYIQERPEEAPIIEDIPYDPNLVQEKPKFKGGDENSFTKWVAANFNYPEEAQKNGISGRVTLQFIVGIDGNVSDVKVLRGISPELDREAARVVSTSPKWTPGKQYGKPVRVKYIFPITFQLK